MTATPPRFPRKRLRLHTHLFRVVQAGKSGCLRSPDRAGSKTGRPRPSIKPLSNERARTPESITELQRCSGGLRGGVGQDCPVPPGCQAAVTATRALSRVPVVAAVGGSALAVRGTTA